MNKLANLIIVILKVVHMAILLFVVFGWIFPRVLLPIHLVFIPLMIVQWQFNQGTCILTNIENILRGGVKDKQQQQGQFIKAILGKCFQPLPSDRNIKQGVYGVVWTSWVISATRLFI
ncbi:MAG: DUF2784 family protein [Xenococcaceae cyanobacterium]